MRSARWKTPVECINVRRSLHSGIPLLFHVHYNGNSHGLEGHAGLLNVTNDEATSTRYLQFSRRQSHV